MTVTLTHAERKMLLAHWNMPLRVKSGSIELKKGDSWGILCSTVEGKNNAQILLKNWETMKIRKVIELSRGASFQVSCKDVEYQLVINESGKSWYTFAGVSSNGFTKEYNSITDQKVVTKLNKSFESVVFVPWKYDFMFQERVRLMNDDQLLSELSK